MWHFEYRFTTWHFEYKMIMWYLENISFCIVWNNFDMLIVGGSLMDFMIKSILVRKLHSYWQINNSNGFSKWSKIHMRLMSFFYLFGYDFLWLHSEGFAISPQ